MLELENLFYVQDEFNLSANFAIAQGAKIAVVGPSGAGKSTLLSLISGFEAPQSGALRFDGVEITDLAPQHRPIAHLFQDNNLFAHMSAADNVGLGLKPNLRLSLDQRTRVSEALVQVGLEGFETRRPGALSGGQQSRVALARILVQEKPLMVLDEPFSALGPAMRAEMIDLAKDVSDRVSATMLMVTHDIADVDHFADLVIWVENGKCHAPVDWQEMKADPPQGLKDYLGT